MNKEEVQQATYLGHNGLHLFDGHTAAQWFDIALERDERGESPDAAFTIADVLFEMDGP